MIRRFSKILINKLTTKSPKYPLHTALKPHKVPTVGLQQSIRYSFATTLPKHQILKMPALSPTMSEGKIVKWNKNIGDAVEEGDILCEVETDKATVGFEVTEKGFLAQKKETDSPVPVGTPLVVLVKKKQEVKDFANFNFEGGQSKKPAKQQKKQKGAAEKKQPTKQAKEKQQKQQTGASDKKKQQTKQPKQQKQQKKSEQQPQQEQPAQQNLPKHQQLKMPALSPTMSQGKIVKWNIKEGQEYSEGDSLCDIETDKATVAFEATEKGVLAKIIAKENSQMKVGDLLGISVKKKEDAGKFSEYQAGKSGATKPAAKSQKKQESQKKQKTSKKQESQPEKQTEGKQQKQVKKQSSGTQSDGGRVFVSPAAKNLAKQKGIDLNELGKGSGPNGRIIKQDVQGYKPQQKQKKQQATQASKSQQQEQPQQQKQQQKKPPTPAPTTPKPKPKKLQIPQNPFQQIPLTNMRKTIAARLTESKTTIPHYYITCNVEMDKANALRNELNAHEKQNGVKISVNDIIVKAMALALRDYPNVNSQWHGDKVRKFRYADVSVAVATDGGLITPIVYRACSLGLLDISRRTKDIAKRARQGKLDPRQYMGGSTTVSNLGMFGIDSVTSVINPPQSTIVGVGKTEKRILFDQKSMNPDKPYRVAEVMELVVSADHRVVDGAVAAQWLTRIKKYLENPTHMLL